MRQNEQFYFSMKYAQNVCMSVCVWVAHSVFLKVVLNGISHSSQIIMRVQSTMKWCPVIYCSNLFRIKWKLINYACLRILRCAPMWRSACECAQAHEYTRKINDTTVNGPCQRKRKFNGGNGPVRICIWFEFIQSYNVLAAGYKFICMARRWCIFLALFPGSHSVCSE